METLSTLAKDFAEYEQRHPIPVDQRELSQTLFYFGAACVIDFVRAINGNVHTADEAQTAFDDVCREVRNFSIQQMIGKAFDGVSFHVINVSSSPSDMR